MRRPCKESKEQLANLAKLATHLESLPANYGHFDMSGFLDIGYGSDVTAASYAKTGVLFIEEGTCGTTACALGHGPAAGILLREEDFDSRQCAATSIKWNSYQELFICPDDVTWEWLFGGGWDENQRTYPNHYAAAARIKYYLDAGDVPTNFRDEKHDHYMDSEYFEECSVPYLKKEIA